VVYRKVTLSQRKVCQISTVECKVCVGMPAADLTIFLIILLKIKIKKNYSSLDTVYLETIYSKATGRPVD
jgi:hypothetical protein